MLFNDYALTFQMVDLTCPENALQFTFSSIFFVRLVFAVIGTNFESIIRSQYFWVA